MHRSLAILQERRTLRQPYTIRARQLLRSRQRRPEQIAIGAAPSQITAMPAHRFRVGQTVVVPWSGPEGALPLGPYVIVRLLPVEDGEPHYRVRSSVDGHERALLERQIMSPQEPPPKVEAPPARSARRRRQKGSAGHRTTSQGGADSTCDKSQVGGTRIADPGVR
jgi:hypothetical protein